MCGEVFLSSFTELGFNLTANAEFCKAGLEDGTNHYHDACRVCYDAATNTWMESNDIEPRGSKQPEVHEIWRCDDNNLDQLHGCNRGCEGIGRHHDMPADAQADDA